MTDYNKLRLSLEHLEVQWENLRGSDSRYELSPLDRDAIAESVIQRFETAFDQCWKTLKRHLDEELGLVNVSNSPKGVLRAADDNGLIAGRIEEWIEYTNIRNSTAHDYSMEKAQEAIRYVQQFLPDAIALYTTMTGDPWR